MFSLLTIIVYYIMFEGPAYPNKTAIPIQYADGVFRLELNSALYEGVRFGFVHVTYFDGIPWHITSLRIVCQILPQNYLGNFESDQDILTRIWWTGAYTVKLNLLPDGFNSILIDRGDRIRCAYLDSDLHASISSVIPLFTYTVFISIKLDRRRSYESGCSACGFWKL